MKLTWSRVKAGQPCNVVEAYRWSLTASDVELTD